jgi:hypothetical protein
MASWAGGQCVMAPSDDAANMLAREFATALRRAREEETERMRNSLYSLELLRDGMADLVTEVREKAAAAAQKSLIK